LRCLSAAWDEYGEPNEQSVVLKIEYAGSSVMLAGDTTFKPWKEKILPTYSASDLKSSILLAAHHGSLTFFDDPEDETYYYTSHIKAIAPAMTLISVGPNVHGLPNAKAVELYENNSTGSDKGNKVFSTDDKGTMKLTLKGDGDWSLLTNQ
jgi:beta-lactamase superfamily II metal-dependent hydrolase